MASKIFGPRKRRTRQHVIADQSVHHVEGFILDEGHTAERVHYDYGYDLVMRTFDARGYIEPNYLLFQIKASDVLGAIDGDSVYDIAIRDYNLWTREQMPVIFVLYDATAKRAYWIHLQGYFSADSNRRPAKGAKWVRLRIPRSQEVSRQAIAEFRRLKAEVVNGKET